MSRTFDFVGQCEELFEKFASARQLQQYLVVISVLKLQQRSFVLIQATGAYRP